MRIKAKAERRREQVRDRLWPNVGDRRWPPTGSEGGWFKAPRALPILLLILKDKRVVGETDAGRVYIELLSRVWDTSLVEIGDETEHATLSGYARSERGLRSWRERIRILTALGFIEVQPRGAKEFGYVLILNPAPAIERLRDARKIEDGWFNMLHELWIDSGGPIPAKPTQPPQFRPVVIEGGAEQPTPGEKHETAGPPTPRNKRHR